MPSIRIKSQLYSPLSDSFQVDEDQQHDLTRPELHHQSSLPAIREDGLSPPPPTGEFLGPSFRRNRGSTVSSGRVTEHIWRNSRPMPNFDPPGSATSPTSSPSLSTASPRLGVNSPVEMRTVEGNQAVLRIPSPTQGLVEHSIHEDKEQHTNGDDHHHDDVVEHLDVIDPQISTISNLTNTVNSIFIPPSTWYSRKPVVVLPTLPPQSDGEEGEHFEDSLDRHVDDVLRRPSKWKRIMAGVWAFLKTPMGFLSGIYAFLVVFWGAAIVFFLARIINFHNENTQGFWVEVSSQVVTGLFTVTSIGLIPFRVLDTYRIYKIWSYKRKTKRLRAKAGLPQLFDVDDLPDPIYDPNYVHVLTDEEQEDLHRQQRKFAYSQTWYRAHGTETHRAFPITTALWICFLNDGNSLAQCFLCGTMWGLNRFERPAWTTGILIPAGFLCGIGAGVLIWRGGAKTKRVEQVRERLRAALAERSIPVGRQPFRNSIRRHAQLVASQQKELPHVPSRDSGLAQQSPSIVIDEEMTIPKTLKHSSGRT